MTHQAFDEQRDASRLSDIVAADEMHTTLGKQIMNGIGGLLMLLATGVLLVLLVLWKSP